MDDDTVWREKDGGGLTQHEKSGVRSSPRPGVVADVESGTERPFIDVSGVSVSYSGRTILRDVTFSVRRGSITALIGPSGCGKTSFLCTLNRLTDLLPGCEVQGAIHVGGENVLASGTDVVRLRKRVGMIFQRPNPFPLSIRKNLDLPLLEHGVRSKGARGEAITAALKDVGLWDEVSDRLDAPAQQLSGGQQQRLCFARALVLRPEVLLLDEPCSALDPISSSVIERLIVSLRERYTVVIVTHNLAQARRVADSAALFWVGDGSGQLVEHGPVHQIFEAPQDSITESYVNGAAG